MPLRQSPLGSVSQSPDRKPNTDSAALIIRSAPANPSDSIFCNRLAYQAVHGAMAGKTRFVVGLVHNQMVYLPIPAVTGRRKKIDLEGEFWFAALQSTGQPYHLG